MRAMPGRHRFADKAALCSCLRCAGRRAPLFTMSKRKHKDDRPRYFTPQCLIISSQQWQPAPAPTPRRRSAVLLGQPAMRRCALGRTTPRRISKAGDAQTCTRYCYSPAAMVAALGHAPSTLRALHWEATVVPGAWIGAYFVELFCWATAPVEK